MGPATLTSQDGEQLPHLCQQDSGILQVGIRVIDVLLFHFQEYTDKIKML